MTKYDEIFLITRILSHVSADGEVQRNRGKLQKLFLDKNTVLHEDYLHQVQGLGLLNYEEIGKKSFPPIIMCSIKPETKGFLK